MTSDDIRVEYSVEFDDDELTINEVADKIASAQSIGDYNYRWEFGDSVDEEREAVINRRYPEKNIIKVDFPTENISPRISQLLNYIGGDIFDAQYVDRIKIEAVQFPPEFSRQFPTPQFGIEGIRELVGVTDRPLLGLIVKRPDLPPEDVRSLVETGSKAGADVIKEDIKFVSPSGSTLPQRLRAIAEGLRAVEADTGSRPLYVLNITGKTRVFEELVGGDSPPIDISDIQDSFVLMQSPLTTGFDQMEYIATNDDLQFPLYAHWAGHGVYTRTNHGISMDVIEKFFHLSGADLAHVGNVDGDHARKEAHIQNCRRALLGRSHGATGTDNSTLPVVSHGVTPLNIHKNITLASNTTLGDAEGREQLFVVGSAIHAYPGEDMEEIISGGVKACREGIRAALEEDIGPNKTITDNETYGHLKEWRDKVPNG